MFSRHVLGCLLILAASVLPTFGQMRPSNSRNTYSIAGSVRDESDQHIMENVRVNLMQSGGVLLMTTFTGGNGEFDFSGVTNGEYFVEVVEKDYEPAQQAVNILNSTRRGVTIFLTRSASVVKSGSAGSISAHQLSAPHKAHDEYDKGLNLMYAKADYQGAISQFQRAIKDFPTYYEAYAQEGYAYLRLKDLAPAEEAMRKSIELSAGQYSDAIFMLAALLNETNRYTDAETVAKQGAEVDTASWRGPFELARALSGLKQLEEAEKSAIEARDMKPDNPPVYLMLANIHIQRHDYRALSKDLDAYLKLVPAGPDAEQARKMRDNVQSAMQQAEIQAQANAQEKPHPPDALDASRVNMASPSTEKVLPPASPSRFIGTPFPAATCERRTIIIGELRFFARHK